MIRNSSNKKIIHCNLMQSFVAAVHDEKAAVVIHNTRSCSSIAMRAYFGLRNRVSGVDREKLGKGNNLFCTALTDKEAVFGGNDKLERCLLDICRERKPDYILVACGCVPGVMGDDVKTVCNMVREKTGVPVLLLPGAGFMVPGLLDMVLAATEMLFSEFTCPLAGKVSKRNDAAIIIGLSAYYISKDVFQEIRELLALLGFTKIYCPPVGETKIDYQEMASVSLAASLCLGVVQKEAGRQLAERFAKTLNIPMLDLNRSFEPSDTVSILRTAEQILGESTELKRIVNEKQTVFEKKKEQASKMLSGKTCLLAADLPFRFFRPKGTIHFLQSLGMVVKGFVLLDTVRAGKREDAEEFIRDNKLDMRCYSMSEAVSAADVLVTGMPLQIPMKQFVFQPQHFSFEGWRREIDRLTGLVLGRTGGGNG